MAAQVRLATRAARSGAQVEWTLDRRRGAGSARTRRAGERAERGRREWLTRMDGWLIGQEDGHNRARAHSRSSVQCLISRARAPVRPCVDQPTGPLPRPFVVRGVRLYGCRVGRHGARGIGFGKGLRRNGHEKYSAAAAAAVALALIQLGTSWASPPSFTRLTYSVMIVANDPSDMRPLGPGLTDMNRPMGAK